MNCFVLRVVFESGVGRKVIYKSKSLPSLVAAIKHRSVFDNVIVKTCGFAKLVAVPMLERCLYLRSKYEVGDIFVFPTMKKEVLRYIHLFMCNGFAVVELELENEFVHWCEVLGVTGFVSNLTAVI
jgi:hypothetical protein